MLLYLAVLGQFDCMVLKRRTSGLPMKQFKEPIERNLLSFSSTEKRNQDYEKYRCKLISQENVQCLYAPADAEEQHT